MHCTYGATIALLRINKVNKPIALTTKPAVDQNGIHADINQS